MEIMNETAADLIQRAEAAGFEVREVAGLAVATLPSAKSPAEAEPIVAELAARVPEIARELTARAVRTRERRLVGRPALCVSFLQVGTIERFDENMIVVRGEMPQGGLASRVFRRDDLMLIADADDRRAERFDGNNASGDPQRNFFRQIQDRGVRLWIEDGIVVVGWPGICDPSIALPIIRDALREAAEWGATRARSRMGVDAVAAEVLSDAFLAHVRADQPMVLAFARRKQRDRETAARLLLLTNCFPDLRRILPGEAIEAVPTFEELCGAHALVSASALVVTIESRNATGVTCRDRTGRALRIQPDQLLVIETERAPKRPTEKPGLLSMLRW